MSFQRLKTFKHSRDPDDAVRKDRILHLYGLMDGTADPLPGDPEVVICVDEFGPLNLQPHPGRQWARRGGGGPSPRRRIVKLRSPDTALVGPPPTVQVESGATRADAVCLTVLLGKCARCAPGRTVSHCPPWSAPL